MVDSMKEEAIEVAGVVEGVIVPAGVLVGVVVGTWVVVVVLLFAVVGVFMGTEPPPDPDLQLGLPETRTQVSPVAVEKILIQQLVICSGATTYDNNSCRLDKVSIPLTNMCSMLKCMYFRSGSNLVRHWLTNNSHYTKFIQW
jgi:hypothetical protein